ncbi:MAG: hypothetical protein KF855_03370 [Acidobacteria bacterium]|nr:hypothetical protein [Acidobacteriota bacterium]
MLRISQSKPQDIGEERANYKEPSAPLEDFLRGVAKQVKEESEAESVKYRLRSAIKMLALHREATTQDRYGFWQGDIWSYSPAFEKLRGGVNIFQALIRGAEANFTQATPRLDIKANRSDFRGLATEKVARGLYEILHETQWTEKNQQALFYAMILKMNGFVISRMRPQAGSVTTAIPQFEESEIEIGGRYQCLECYEVGQFDSQAEMACEYCGSEQLLVMDEPEIETLNLMSGITNEPVGMPEIIVADIFDVSMDDSANVSGDMSKCQWVEYRELVHKSELKRLYPHLKCEEKTEWSYATRLKEAFKRCEYGECYPSSERDRDTYELRHIWVSRNKYEDYVAPQTVKIGKFILKRGERLADRCPDNLVMGLAAGQIAFIEPENHAYVIKSAVWLSDGISNYGLGASSGIGLQRKVDYLDNLAVEGEARSLSGSIIYDGQAIDGNRLEGQNLNVPLKQDFQLNGSPIRNFFEEVRVSGLSLQSLGYLQGQMDAMQKVMGVPDVTLGEDTSSDKTASGQQLRSRNAVGLLIPAKKSEAHLMEGWLNDQLHLVQRFMPPDAIQQFASFYGEEWTDDEVQAFLEADMDREIRISYAEGTEVPETRDQKQIKLRQDIAAGFVPMSPAIQAKLIRESGYDDEVFDAANYNSNLAIGRKRWDWVKDQVKANPELEMGFEFYEAQLTDPVSGMRMVDEMNNPIPNPLAQQFLTAPELQVNKHSEDHAQQGEYWKARQREAVAGLNDTSKLLVAICDGMITAHIMAAMEMQQKGMMLEHLAMAPAQLTGQMASAQVAQAMAPPEERAKDGQPIQR